ncbi:hypothetical protein LTR37_012065 [Vermiconidia calcicola]|uniref:Uncharacterized protein n=1 Tax=Vermiconidia calcicola TaxID=1690605 RepID=A0ACC3N1W6_9PEZI|nr:hypothetical protein LTR37_012065 [Vermiconidia calcicola]
MARRPSSKVLVYSTIGITILFLSLLPIIQSLLYERKTPDFAPLRALEDVHPVRESLPELLVPGPPLAEPVAPPPGLTTTVTALDDTQEKTVYEQDVQKVRNIVKRVPDFTFPSKETFEEYKRKGFFLVSYMEDPKCAWEKAKTKFDNVVQLAKWGWVNQIAEDDRSVDFSREHVVDDIVGTTKGLDFEWRHTRAGRDGNVPNEITYQPTDATYDNIFWPDKGVIVSNINQGPDHMVKTGMTPKQTKEGLECDPNPGRAPEWPRMRRITPLMPGSNALLYTPNVRGVVWLLVQHHTTFGKTQIKSITAYHDNRFGYAPNLDIEIAPIE